MRERDDMTKHPSFTVYFGNSAALSFLQSIQELMEVDDTLHVLSAGASNNLASEDLVLHDGDSFSLHKYINGPDMLSLVEVFFTSVKFPF
jgi:hypothetical protein